MRKLFLSSAGLSESTKDSFLKLLGKDPKSSRVVVITTASDVEENKSYVDRDINYLRKMGFAVNRFDIKSENQESLTAKLSRYDVILVEGGNTFYLLDYVRKSGFDKALGNLLKQGKVYFGVSAGSYIACPNIEAATWKHADKNIPGLKDLAAMNFVPFLISAHYNRAKYKEAVRNGAGTAKYPVVALYDSQAIVIEDDKYKVVGDGKREFFNGFKEN